MASAVEARTLGVTADWTANDSDVGVQANDGTCALGQATAVSNNDRRFPDQRRRVERARAMLRPAAWAARSTATSTAAYASMLTSSMVRGGWPGRTSMTWQRLSTPPLGPLTSLNRTTTAASALPSRRSWNWRRRTMCARRNSEFASPRKRMSMVMVSAFPFLHRSNAGRSPDIPGTESPRSVGEPPTIALRQAATFSGWPPWQPWDGRRVGEQPGERGDDGAPLEHPQQAGLQRTHFLSVDFRQPGPPPTTWKRYELFHSVSQRRPRHHQDRGTWVDGSAGSSRTMVAIDQRIGVWSVG